MSEPTIDTPPQPAFTGEELPLHTQGVYLEDVEAWRAEQIRAVAERRKPDESLKPGTGPYGVQEQAVPDDLQTADLSDKTVAELHEILVMRGITYPPRAKKAQLLEFLGQKI